MSRRYDKKTIFEEPIQPTDHFGTEKAKWTEVWRAFVSLNPATGGEKVVASQTQADMTHTVRTHWPLSVVIDETMRMKIAKPKKVDEDPNSDDNFRIFNIVDVNNVDEANREMKLIVIERLK